MPIATKPGRMMSFPSGPIAIKSHDPLITWSCKITWQTKTISPLPQCLWHLMAYLKRHLSIKLHSLARSHDKLKTFYHYFSAYVHQTCKGSDLLKRVPTIKSDRFLVIFVARSRDKLKASPLPQGLWPPNWAGWQLVMRGPTHNVTWSFNHVVLWVNQTN